MCVYFVIECSRRARAPRHNLSTHHLLHTPTHSHLPLLLRFRRLLLLLRRLLGVSSLLTDNIEGYHAFTDMRGGEFGKGGGGERRAAASTLDIHGIYLRMRDVDTGAALALPGLTLTFLHECAHVLSPIVLVKKARGGPTSGLGRNASTVDKKWFHDAHNNDFYENFNELLRTAEKLKLLKFSAAPGKFTTKWTQRIDGLTAADCCHFLTLLEVESEGLKPPLSPEAAAGDEAPKELTLTLCHPQKGKKVVKFSSSISVKELTKLCKKKLGGRQSVQERLVLRPRQEASAY